MKETAYVSKEFIEKAREFEKRFQALPEAAGVLFVTVDAQPAIGGHVEEFKILLGISKRLHESVGWGLIQQVMKDEIALGVYRLSARVFLGVSGACRDESAERPYSNPTKANVSI